MSWTTETPTVPGLYWLITGKLDDLHDIGPIDTARPVPFYIDEGRDGYLFGTDIEFNPEYFTDGLWLGPIAPPPLPPQSSP